MSAAHQALARPPRLVHGMERELAVEDWPALTDEEVRVVLAHGDIAELSNQVGDIHVAWASPRPMSAAALVSCAHGEYFVKRHHVRVRSPERLRVEHAFAQHLRDQGLPVARVLAGSGGDTVVRQGDFVYEVHEKAVGLDLYREMPSWYPFIRREHARAAGRALGRLHEAARNFTASATPPGVLTNSMVVVASSDPLSALCRLMDSRPALARALEDRDVVADFAHDLGPAIESAAPLVARLTSQWGHGDWHPSNLTWTSCNSRADVASVLDFGLANRTTAVHDLALALERSVVDWLDLSDTGDVRADIDAVNSLLDGYESVRPLGENEVAALIAVLPVVHLEFALSEVEYFADVVHSVTNTFLAYDGYLIGHARWFQEARGVELIRHLQRRWS